MQCNWPAGIWRSQFEIQLCRLIVLTGSQPAVTTLSHCCLLRFKFPAEKITQTEETRRFTANMHVIKRGTVANFNIIVIKYKVMQCCNAGDLQFRDSVLKCIYGVIHVNTTKKHHI